MLVMSTVAFIPEPGTANYDLNVTVVTISASLSFVGCLFIIITYLWLRLTDQYHLKCIFILSVVEFCISIVFLVGSRFDETLEITWLQPYVCSSVDTLLHFLFISSFMWTGCIAHMLLRVINYEDETIDRYFKFYNLISWGVPFLIVLALVLRHVWFNALCDPTKMGEYSIVRILFFIPLMLAWLLNMYAFFKVSKKLYKERKLHRRHIRLAPETGGPVVEETPTLVNTQRLFLVAFAVCWIWAIVLAFFGFFNIQKNINWLITINYAFTPLPGLCNSIIFGLNDALKARISVLITCCHKIAPDEVNESLLGARYNNEEFLLWRGNSVSDFENHSVQ